MLGRSARARETHAKPIGGLPGLPHFAPKAKRVHLPAHGRRAAADGPVRLQAEDEGLVRQGSAGVDPQGPAADHHDLRPDAGFPIAPSIFKFAQHGKRARGSPSCCRTRRRWWTTSRSSARMHTEAINHEPAITFIQTGNMIAGRPCLGSWIAYGLGSMNQDLPTFVVLNAKHIASEGERAGDLRPAVERRLSLRRSTPAWRLRAGGDPVLYINNPDGVPAAVRRRMLDGLSELNQINYQKLGDPETQTRIAQYEMAFRMQTSVPELTDLSKEPDSTYKLYGDEARKAGTFANTLPDGAPAGGARRALRAGLPSRLGCARQPAGSAAQPVQGRRPGLLWRWCRI